MSKLAPWGHKLSCVLAVPPGALLRAPSPRPSTNLHGGYLVGLLSPPLFSSRPGLRPSKRRVSSLR